MEEKGWNSGARMRVARVRLWKEDGETREGRPKRPVGDLDHDGRWAGWSKERRSLEFVAFALSAVAKVCRLQLVHSM